MSNTGRLAQIAAIYDIRRRVAERKVALAAAAVAKATREERTAFETAARTEADELTRIRSARADLLSAPFTREAATQVRRTVELALEAISGAQADAVRKTEMRTRLDRTRSQLARDLQKRNVKHDRSVERLRASKSQDGQAAERRAVEEYVESRARVTS